MQELLKKTLAGMSGKKTYSAMHGVLILSVLSMAGVDIPMEIVFSLLALEGGALRAGVKKTEKKVENGNASDKHNQPDGV